MNPANIWANIPAGDEEYDVIVVGSGMAGIGAAVASAKNGAKTLLLEANPFFGGVTHTCLWMPTNRVYLPGYHGGGQPAEISRGGVHAMFIDSLKALGCEAWAPGSVSSKGFDGGSIIIHPDYLRLAVFNLLDSVGCHYRLNSPVTGVLKEGQTVTGVVVTGKDGRREYRAKVVVDATGDADIAWLAGTPTQKGRPEDGKLMPVTLTFVLGNVDYAALKAWKPGRHNRPMDVSKLSAQEQEARYQQNPASVTAEDDAFYAMIREARQQGYTTAAWYAFTKTTVPDVITCNNGGLFEAGNLDGTQVQDLVFAERVGIQIAVDFIEIARKWHMPGLSDCHLLRVAAPVAVRESRRIVGDYALSIDDLREDTQFEDVVAINYEGVADNVYYHGLVKMGTQIPYRSLLPKGIEGLLVAGRCISTTYEACSGIRGQGTVMAIGQAAGVAAALSSRAQVTPRQMEVGWIQQALLEMGAELTAREKRGPFDF